MLIAKISCRCCIFLYLWTSHYHTCALIVIACSFPPVSRLNVHYLVGRIHGSFYVTFSNDMPPHFIDFPSYFKYLKCFEFFNVWKELPEAVKQYSSSLGLHLITMRRHEPSREVQLCIFSADAADDTWWPSHLMMRVTKNMRFSFSVVIVISSFCLLKAKRIPIKTVNILTNLF